MGFHKSQFFRVLVVHWPVYSWPSWVKIRLHLQCIKHVKWSEKYGNNGSFLFTPATRLRQQFICFVNFQLICQENWKLTDKTLPLPTLSIARSLGQSLHLLWSLGKLTHKKMTSLMGWGHTYRQHYFCRCCRVLSLADSGMLISSSSQLPRELQSPDKDLFQRLNCESHLLRNYMCCGKGRRRGRSEIITYASH